jgi:cell division protein FtsZ
MTTTIKFELPKQKSSIIKVIGVGGGGGNAVNHMYTQGIKGVDFIICNTDSQALELSPVPNKIQIGNSLTEGRGAGANPEVGKKAAMENVEDIIELLGVNTKMLFVTAGMGGGTGTGAAPIIAQTARELGILTVGIVTSPFAFEGKKRRQYAEEGIAALKKSVDCLIVISNDKIREIFGKLSARTAFGQADDILSTAAKGIAEIITVPGYINVDFEDVKTVMTNSGVAIMGAASGQGKERAKDAISLALNSPLLSDNDIRGAKYILLNITSGTDEVLIDEITEITQYIEAATGVDTDMMILGTCTDESIGDKLSVTIIATGFETRENKFIIEEVTDKKIVMSLEEKPVEPKEVPQVSNVAADAPGKQVELPLNAGRREVEAGETVRFDLNSSSTIEHDDTAGENSEEKIRKIKERIIHLKNLNLNLNSQAGMAEMDKEPAYKRKNIRLEDVPHSSESQVSKFSLIEEPNKKPELKSNNSFLHDNVD